MTPWIPYLAHHAGHRAPCVLCGQCSSLHPSRQGWRFQWVPIRGAGRHGPRIISIRICPPCITRAEAVP